MKRRVQTDSVESFARVEGSPGEAPRITGLLRTLWPLFILFAVAGYLLRAALPSPVVSRTVIGFLFLLLACAFGYFIFWSESRLRQYIKGARGEESVARILGFLPSSYRIFHGVALPRRGLLNRSINLDHVIIGPTGLYVVETKNWSGRITVEAGAVLYNGVEPDRPPLDQVRAAADALQVDLSDLLRAGVEVRPVLCFASSNVGGKATGASGVIICRADTLCERITDTVETPVPQEVQRQAARYLEELMGHEGV